MLFTISVALAIFLTYRFFKTLVEENSGKVFLDAQKNTIRNPSLSILFFACIVWAIAYFFMPDDLLKSSREIAEKKEYDNIYNSCFEEYRSNDTMKHTALSIIREQFRLRDQLSNAPSNWATAVRLLCEVKAKDQLDKEKDEDLKKQGITHTYEGQ